MEIVSNIRRIGIFLIAAQTVMHFAAGKQYEKYIKAITSVIVLAMFIAPFLDTGGDAGAYWQERMDALERGMQTWSEAGGGAAYVPETAEAAALEQIEESIAARLNDATADSTYRVADVRIDLEETGTGSASVRNWAFRRVEVAVEEAGRDDAEEGYGDISVRVGQITVGGRKEGEAEQDGGGPDDRTEELRRIFARELGVSEDKVEVTYRGAG